jgi:hypothetical protein
MANAQGYTRDGSARYRRRRYLISSSWKPSPRIDAYRIALQAVERCGTADRCLHPLEISARSLIISVKRERARDVAR